MIKVQALKLNQRSNSEKVVESYSRRGKRKTLACGFYSYLWGRGGMRGMIAVEAIMAFPLGGDMLLSSCASVAFAPTCSLLHSFSCLLRLQLSSHQHP